MKIVVRVIAESVESFRAWCPSLPGCVARGRSQDEARMNMEGAIRGYLASMNVPEPHHVEQHLIVG